MVPMKKVACAQWKTSGFSAVAPALLVDAVDPDVVVAHFGTGLRRAIAVEDHPADRVQRPEQPGQPLGEEVEWSLTAAPSCGYMFCMDPARALKHPRQSPKSFQVSESGPRGTASYPLLTGQPDSDSLRHASSVGARESGLRTP